MNALDRALQRWRFRVAVPHLPPGAQVLDVGAHEGDLFDYLDGRIGPSVGIEPDLADDRVVGRHRLLAGCFPASRPDGQFDAATLLAVVEHLSDEQVDEVGRALVELVRPGGTVVVTVPSPMVDKILDVAIALHVLDGMEAEEHHGFEVGSLVERWTRCGLRLRTSRRFQLGLNNLFVFEV